VEQHYVPRVTTGAKDMSRWSLFQKCLKVLAVRFDTNHESSQRHNEHVNRQKLVIRFEVGARVDRDMAVARKFRRPFMQIIGGPQG